MNRTFYQSCLMAILIVGMAVQPSFAKATSPWLATDSIRQALFDAQAALLVQDLAAAHEGVEQAAAQFEAALAGPLADGAPDAFHDVQSALETARAAALAGDADRLSLARAQVWTGLLRGSYLITLEALQSGKPDEARAWLRVREYRQSTRFTRPDADAVLALEALVDQRITADEALAVVRADLLDAYQAQLNGAFQDIADALQQGLTARAAEAAGSAQGYWRILAPIYEEQQGKPKRDGMDAQFDALVEAVQYGRTSSLDAMSGELEHALAGFRAAPLSEAEQIRRTGQFIRFLALVPIEYERGVQNGQVFIPLEIQEAVSFMAGGRAAFVDLQPLLSSRDPSGAAEIASQLNQLEGHLTAANRREQVVEPDVIAGLAAGVSERMQNIVPAEWLESNPDADFDVLASILDQIEAAVAQGEYAQAESARLEAYAIFDFGLEPRLLAFAPQIVAQIDGLFWQGYNGEAGLAQAIAVKAPAAEVGAIRVGLDAALSDARYMLGDLPTSSGAIISNAAIIVFREGLEAVVILAALIASMVGEYRRYRRPMVLGAALALLATGVTWLLAQQILLSFSRLGERLEAVVSLIAIGILLLITNWFFHKTYWNDWLASFHQQKRRLINRETGQLVGLILLGFTSIYREGFETVLFLQALVLDAGAWVVLEGVAVGLAAVAVVGIITFRLNVRLPYKRMLVFTGVLIGLVLVTMVGHTIHVMQAVGWMPIRPIPGIVLPYWLGLWFGLHPTWQGVLAQIGAAVFVIGSYFLAEHMQHSKRGQITSRNVQAKTG